MKRIILIIIYIILVPFVTFASPHSASNTLTGFGGYDWGTEIDIIANSENLIYQSSFTARIKNYVNDKSANEKYIETYSFADNKLVSVYVYIYDRDEYFRRLDELYLAYQSPTSYLHQQLFWTFPKTVISIDPFFPSDKKFVMIMFSSQEYITNFKNFFTGVNKI